MNVNHLTPRQITPDDDRHYWFGYFDKSPYEPEGERVLAHRASFIDRFPASTDAADIGLLDPANRAFEPIARSHAWNWQQGSHVQWLADPAADGATRILYNDRRDNRPVSVVCDAAGNEDRVLPHPALAVSPDGRYAATLHMGRLTRLRREYGLPGIEDPSPNDPAPADDGISIMDIVTGETKLIVSMRELASFGVEEPVTFHQHVNHALFNPSSTRLCFMHRYERADGIMHSRLFTVNRDGTDAGGGLRMLFEGLVSHYDWLDDGRILAWAGKRGLLGGGTSSGGASPIKAAMTLARKGLKPVYYALGKPRFLMNKILKDAYHIIHDAAPSDHEVFARGELITDGHPTVSPDGRWLVTDGYPDTRSRQPLYLWDLRDNQGYEIGRFHAPRELDGEIRVDLHPRFNRDGTHVCFDSAMTGRRAMYDVDVTPVTRA
ncbi:MAG: hypothetical protein CMJ31_06860 [Phycisphaerae bacterium]|nr:hypothetical protein [Phycisphaerae bacterium]